MLRGIISAHDQGGAMEFLKAILAVLIVATAGIVLYFGAMFILGLVVSFGQFIGRNIDRFFNKEEES